jgi:hypothetical protein
VVGEIALVSDVLDSENALAPGFVQSGKRMLVQLGQVKVFDGGSDGSVTTAGNSIFEVEIEGEGVFAP